MHQQARGQCYASTDFCPKKKNLEGRRWWICTIRRSCPNTHIFAANTLHRLCFYNEELLALHLPNGGIIYPSRSKTLNCQHFYSLSWQQYKVRDSPKGTCKCHRSRGLAGTWRFLMAELPQRVLNMDRTEMTVFNFVNAFLD